MTLTRRTVAAGLPILAASGFAARSASAAEKPFAKPLAVAHRGISGMLIKVSEDLQRRKATKSRHPSR